MPGFAERLAMCPRNRCRHAAASKPRPSPISPAVTKPGAPRDRFALPARGRRPRVITAPGGPTRRDPQPAFHTCRAEPGDRRLQPRIRRAPSGQGGDDRRAGFGGGRQRRDSDGRTRGGDRPAEQTQRDRSRFHAETGPGHKGQGCGDPAASVRFNRAVGSRAADRRVRPARRPALRPALGTRLLGLALQGKPVAQRGRAPGL